MHSKLRQTHYHSKPILEELEARQLFSAGVEGLLTEPMLDPNAVYANANPAPVAETQQPPAQNSGNQAPRNEIVFVDTRVDGYQTLLNDIKSSDVSDRNLEIIALDSNSDGIQQISQVLAERDNLDAVHIISHGSDGSLDLGNSQLNFDTLIRNQTDISAWGDSFNQNGDILLYGCNVAETQFGQSFVDYLAGITNTEIAASEDATGSADLGGDWQLEYQTGAIESQVAVSATEQTDWTGLMAVTANGSISSTNSTGTNSLTWSHGVATGTDRALFVQIALDDPNVSVNSVTYGGVALTQVGRSAVNHAVEIWSLVNPTVGSANIVVSLSGTTGVAAGATTYNGVAQSTAYYGFVGASGTGTTSSVTAASATGDLVIDAQYWQGIPSGGAVGSGQTLLWQRQNAVLTGGSTSEAGAASVVMSGSFSSSAQWEIAAVSIKAASASAPTITTSGGSLAYTENAAATVIDSALTVSDIDSTHLSRATVSISSGFVSGQDTLAFTNQNGITGSWNASTGILTLTGNATVANYQTALRSITYTNSSDAPNTATRTVSFVVNDGSNASAAATRTISITAVNDAPSDLYAISGVAESSLIGVYGFTNPSNLGRDAAGNNAPMTLYGNPGQTMGPSGNGALDLAGGASGQYGDIVGITTGGAMTFAASVKFDSTGDWQRVFDFGQTTSGGIGNVYVGREWNTNNLTFTIEKNGVYTYRATANSVITNGSWLHFAATVDASGNMNLYVNGNLAASTTGVALETGVRSNNFIGKSHWGADAAFDGAIDNFVVANGVMTASQVAALYQQTSGFTVAENAANGTVIGTVVGFDVDASANPSYSLTDSAGGRFAINSTNGTLTVADGSLLNYEAATSHSITVQVTDSLGASYSETYTVSLSNVVDGPTATNLNASETYTEDTALNLTDIVITRGDSATVTATLTLSNAAAGSLNTGTSGAVTSTYNAATGVWTASGAVADVNTLLAGLTFTPASNFNSNFTIATSISDGVLAAVTGTKAMTGVAVNDAPVFSNLNGSPTFIENGSAVVLDADVSLFDSELSVADNFSGSTLTLARHGGANADDALAFDGITVTVSGANVYVSGVQVGTYTFTGGQMDITFGANATNARVNTLMRNTVYWNWSDTPPASVQIDWTFSDANASAQGSGGALTATGSTTVNITAVNDAPVINVVSARTTDEDVVKRFSAWIGNAITISDADAGSSNLEMTISATNGTVTLGGLVGLTFSVGDGAADTTMTFRGTLAAINTALDNIDYMPDPNYSGPGGMQFTLNDLGNTGTGGGLVATATQVITVNPVNDAPTATISPASYSATEQISLTLHGTGLSIADVDAGSSSVQATLSVVSGTLTAGAGTTGVTVSGSGTGSITLTGSLSQINNLLAGNASGSLSYIINSDTPPATDTLTLSVNDQGNTGSGGVLTGFDVATINITAVNDAPKLDAGSSPALNPQTEDAGYPAGAVGTLVSDLVDFASPAGQVDNVFDADAGAKTGIAITAADTTNGLWFYSTDNGTTWNALGAVSGSNALLLAADSATRLYFQPNANFTGTIAQAITFHAWDQTTGINGGRTNIADGTASDQFSTVSYSNNNGTTQWRSNWVETDSNGGGASGGRILVRSAGDLEIRARTVGDNIYREVDLSGASSALLRFDYVNSLGSGDTIVVQVSSNGGSSYTTLAGGTFSSSLNSGSGTFSLDISAHAVSNTRVRFYVSATGDENRLYIDNVQVLTPSNDTGGTTAFSVDSDTAAITVNAVNDAPTVVNPIADQSASEDSAFSFQVPANSFADVDVGDALSYTATLADGSALPAWLSFNAATRTFSGTPANADVGSLSVRVTATDSNGATVYDDFALSVANVNDAPVLSAIEATTLSYTENGNATVITATLALNDADNANLTGATVQITGNYASGQDVLAFSDQNGITGSWNATTGTLTLSGTATVAQYQTALRSVTYQNTSDAPSTASRTVSFSVTDGTTSSNTATRNVSVAAVNDAPTATITPSNYSATEQTSLTLHGTGLSIADVDAGSSSVQATLSVVSGTLTASAGTTGVTVSGSGTSSITLTGSLSQINNLLAGNASGSLSYIINSDTPPATDTLTLSVNDQGNTGSGGALTGFDVATINITAVNDAPVNTVYGDGTIVPEDSVIQLLGSVVIADADSGSGTMTTTLSVSAGAGVLSATSASGVTVSGSGTNTLVLSGDVASINAYFASAATAPVFTATADYNGAVSFTVVTTDNGNSGSGGALSDSDTISGSISAVADIVNDSVTTNEDTPVTFNPLANDTFENAGRYISAIDGTSVSSGQTLAITGGSVALNANGTLTFTPTTNSNGATSFSYTVTSGVTTETATVALTVNPVNDAPVLTSASLTLNEGQTVTLTAANFGVTDPDNSSFTYTLSSISGGYFQLKTNPGVAVTSFTTAQLGAGQVQFVDDGNEVAPSFSVTASDGVLDSNTLAATVNYTSVNDAPHVTWAGNYPFGTDEDTASAGISVNTLIMNGPVGSVGYSDADGSSVKGMAVIAKTGSGSWEYSTDGVSWNDFGAVSNTHALLLESNTQVRYVPNGSGAEVAQLQIRGWDQTTDTASSNLAASYGNASINDYDHAYSYEIATVTCTVSSINDAPTLANAIADQNVTEDSAFSFQVPANSFADIDAGDSLSYSATLADGSALPSWLAFNPVNRTFSGTPLNADVGSISVRVTVTDSSNASVFDDFTITVANSNDAPTVANPIADQNASEDSAFSFQVSANTFADVDVGDALSYTATLADGSALPNWLTFNAATQTFSGTPANADVGSISVRVTATDNNGATVYDDFTLTVTNVNDAPVLNLTNTVFNFVEGASHVRIGSSATLADVDSSDFAGGTLTATISGNGTADDRLFLVTQGSGPGQVQVVNANVFIDGNLVATTVGGAGAGSSLVVSFTANADASAVQAVANRVSFRNVSENPSGLQRTVEMVVTDGDGGTSNTDSVLINVTPVNDAPVITGASLTLNEGQTVTLTGANFSISDPDNTSFIYTVSGVTGGYFQLSGNAGVSVTRFSSADLTGGLVQFVDDGNEVAPSFSVTVNDGALDSNTLAATINYTAVNDNTPVISSGSSASVNENSTVNTVVYTASGSDADGDSLSWSLSGADAALLSIDATTGEVTLNAAADYESKTSYSFNVVASDGTFSSSQAATLTVINLNDNTVSTITDSNATVNSVTENAANGTVVGVTALATDADSGATISYSLSDDAGGRFAIDSSTGVVTVADGSLLDYETATSHSITVLATSSDGSTNTESFTINLSNLNDNPVGTLTDSNATINSVAENAANGTVVGITALATDADSGTTISYSLTDDAGGRFAIDSSTGVVTVADGSLLDYETATSHSITILATSSDGSTNSQTFSIAVTNVNDNPVSIITDSDTALNTISENAANGTVVGITALASDADAGASISYSLSDNAGGRFAIDSTTGVVTVADGSLLDYETATSHSITVLATSSDGSTNSQTFSIAVTNVNDNAPVLSSADMTLSEGQTVTLAVSNFGVSDPDNTSFSYIVSNVSGGYFQIASNPGVAITSFTTAQLASAQIQFVDDGNEVAPSFSVTVNDGALESNTVAATINYTGVNDAPVIGSATLTLSQGQTVTLSAANFGVSDPDSASFTYTVSSVSGGYFQLTGNPGASVTSFSSVQLAAGQVQFVDDGNEVVPNFSVTVNDGGASSNLVNAEITYSSSDDNTNGFREIIRYNQTNGSDRKDQTEQSVGDKVLSSVAIFDQVNNVFGESVAVSQIVNNEIEGINNVDILVSVDQGSSEVDKSNVKLSGYVPDNLLQEQRRDSVRKQNFQLKNAALEQYSIDTESVLSEQEEIEFWNRLDHIRQQMSDPDAVADANPVNVKIILGTSASLTAGFVSWILRAGSLMASFMSTVPLLKRFDPLPVLRSARKDSDSVAGSKKDQSSNPADSEDSDK
ncbi:putative Ig domain-containing protein [Methylomonas sp. HW2-6]|uniref:putative Ig domain-containing protein n=1 Tax=Methylomonas sp. HW2-6 TaxID=3376687 RepID=UPI00404236F8